MFIEFKNVQIRISITLINLFLLADSFDFEPRCIRGLVKACRLFRPEEADEK